MKNNKKCMNCLSSKLIFLFVLISITSCTEVINLNINTSDPQIVVEGGIGQGEYAQISLTKSIDLDENDQFPVVENAHITLSNNSGESEILTETKPGFYQSLTLIGKSGKKYFLKIDVNDKIISSESSIPTKVAIDTFSVVNSIYPGGGPPIGTMRANFYEITVGYKDPAFETNYYRILVFLNGVPVSGNSVFTDKFNNGNNIVNTLIMYNEEIKSNDLISVELQCIDKNVYNYFSSMTNGRMGGSSSNPANPYTNLNGAVLGYFSAFTVERKEFVVK